MVISMYLFLHENGQCLFPLKICSRERQTIDTIILIAHEWDRIYLNFYIFEGKIRGVLCAAGKAACYTFHEAGG